MDGKNWITLLHTHRMLIYFGGLILKKKTNTKVSIENYSLNCNLIVDNLYLCHIAISFPESIL